MRDERMGKRIEKRDGEQEIGDNGETKGKKASAKGGRERVCGKRGKVNGGGRNEQHRERQKDGGAEKDRGRDEGTGGEGGKIELKVKQK